MSCWVGFPWLACSCWRIHRWGSTTVQSHSSVTLNWLLTRMAERGLSAASLGNSLLLRGHNSSVVPKFGSRNVKMYWDIWTDFSLRVCANEHECVSSLTTLISHLKCPACTEYRAGSGPVSMTVKREATIFHFHWNSQRRSIIVSQSK